MTNWLGLLNAGSDVTVVIAFVAGVISFLTPCVLPIVPGYVGYLTGVHLHTDKPRRWLLVEHALLFVFGFLIVFVVLGAASGALQHWLAVSKVWLTRLGGIFLIGLGVIMTEWLPWPWLYKTISFQPQRSGSGGQRPRVSLWHSLMTGLTFGFSWSPCIGPLLGTILFLATFNGGSTRGALLLLIFSLGLGVPFIVTALFMEQLLPWLKRFTKNIAWLQKIGGVIIVLLGLMLLFGWQPAFTEPIL